MTPSPTTPTRLIFGRGSFCHVGKLVASLGQRALLVTGRCAMNTAGRVSQLIDDLNVHGVTTQHFCELHAGPTTDDIDQGVVLARQKAIDVVVALGGGTVLDGGKAIAGVMSTDASAADVLHGRAVVSAETPPIVCIPTTAGTGSERNRSAIVTDRAASFRDGIRSDHLYPRAAVVDSELTRTVPSVVAARTGFDVLAHAIESYLSPRATPPCDLLALRTIEVVRRWLPRIVHDPDHPECVEGRDQLSHASSSMGINLSCVGTCFPHRGDKAVGAIRPDISHGQSVALFYPHWLDSCRHAVSQRLADVATHFDRELRGLPPSEAASLGRLALLQFIRELGLSTCWSEFSVSDRDIPRMVAAVAGDLSINPVPLKRSDLPSLLLQIISGESR